MQPPSLAVFQRGLSVSYAQPVTFTSRPSASESLWSSLEDSSRRYGWDRASRGRDALKKTVTLSHLASPGSSGAKFWSYLLRGTVATALLLVFAGSRLYAQDLESDPESYKFRIVGVFWYATPTVTVAGSSAEDQISFNQAFGFQEYSTFNGELDWHFKKKHHLLFIVSPNQTTRTATLQQDITFRNQTFLAGSSATGQIRTYSFAPGYRYDIIHRPHGHLGIVAQINLLDIKATITGSVLQSEQTTVATASGSVFAPLPVLGPEARVYFAKDHLFVDANVKGMYFFGYGNFISTQGVVGLRLGRHIDLVGGYQLGSHLAINGTTDRVSVRLTQRGPTGGLEFNF